MRKWHWKLLKLDVVTDLWAQIVFHCDEFIIWFFHYIVFRKTETKTNHGSTSVSQLQEKRASVCFWFKLLRLTLYKTIWVRLIFPCILFQLGLNLKFNVDKRLSDIFQFRKSAYVTFSLPDKFQTFRFVRKGSITS